LTLTQRQPSVLAAPAQLERGGRENLVLVARLRHLKNPGTVADDLLTRFSPTEAATRRVAMYSSTSTRPNSSLTGSRSCARGRIIVDGTLAELKQLLPPAKVEYVEKQPSLEDVFFAAVGDKQ
jgi:ABC-2 type transport system ATP-binding protein